MFASFAIVIIFLLAFPGVPGNSQEAKRTAVSVGSPWPGARPAQLFISGDGRYMIFSANHGNGWQLLVHDMQQNKTHEIPGLGENPYYAEISSNGKWLLLGKKA